LANKGFAAINVEGGPHLYFSLYCCSNLYRRKLQLEDSITSSHQNMLQELKRRT